MGNANIQIAHQRAGAAIDAQLSSLLAKLDDGTLEVKSGEKVLVNEQGEWEW